MSPAIHYNRDLPAVFASLVTSHTVSWVMEQQPIDWRPSTWQDHWRAHNLPCPQVIGELQQEYAAHGTIRRSFVFTYQDHTPIELFIAAMAWGLGPDNRGPAEAGKILGHPGAAKAIEAVVDTVRQDGAAAGYSNYYSSHRLPQLDVAFITKVLYFAGYQAPQRPRPLIYDRRVAAALVRLPDAPLLPAIEDQVSTPAYKRYCSWAETTASHHGTEPTVVEWALFRLGGHIRDELRA